MNNVHPFESFGPAPYRITKMVEKVHQGPHEYARAGSSCDSCGTSIRYCYTVRCANGAEFQVGSECARKASLSVAEIKAAARAYRAERWAEAERVSRAERLAAERAANLELHGYALTDDEVRISEAQGAAEAGRWLESERKLEARHVGEKGKRIRGLELRIDYVPSYETAYGTTHIFVMRDRAGNSFVWKTAGFVAFEKDGEYKPATNPGRFKGDPRRSAWFVCDATVVDHSEREGLKQTNLNRLKVKSIGPMELVEQTRWLRAG